MSIIDSKFKEELKIEHSLKPNINDIEFLTKKLNDETAELGSTNPFAFFIRNNANEIIAGCNGFLVFGAIYTDQLWVHPEWRKQNLGRELMKHVHDYGRKIGCRMATVATMSFQSQGFYEKLGYKVDFERNGYVNGSSCLFLQLALSEDRTKTIKLLPYDKEWPKMFEAEAIKIKEALGQNCVAIHHIGSTSVPGLAAKPKIDITTVVKPFIPLEWSVNTMIDIFGSLGYTYKGEWNVPFKYGFIKRGDVNVNLHVYEEGHPEIEVSLLFRDYLRKNNKARDEYTALKEEILKDPLSSVKTYSIFPAYTLRKNDFILNVLKQNDFKRTRFVKCTHHNEIQAAKYFRQKYFFDKASIKDPYIWTFNHPDHVHFILYQGTLIIGYGHIQLCSNAKAILRIIVIEQEKRNQGLGVYFLKLIEKWLKNQNYRTIHSHSSPAAIEFYKKYGYHKMPFNDPDGYESDPFDIPVGKNL